MKTLITVLAICIIAACGSNNTPSPTYYEAKMTVEEQEQSDPTSFLEADGTYRQNLIDEWVIEGTISNNATVATYKDVVVKIVYFSKTHTELGTEEETIYEFFPPNSKRKFKVKSAGYEGTESIGFTVVSAVAGQ